MAAFFITSGSMLTLFLLATGVLFALNVSADDITTERFKMCNNMRVCNDINDAYCENTTYLDLSFCGWTQIDNNFDGLPNLNRIYLNNNYIVQLNTTALRAVPKLDQLSLHDNKLSEAPVFVEESCPKLTVLALQHNQITEINNPDTLSACRNLKFIFLSDNKIGKIHSQSFSKLTELERLYLGTNKLVHIHEEMLAKNHKLKELSLADNRLTRLPPDFVVNLKRTAVSLEQLYLFANPWHCTCLVEVLSDIKRANVPTYKRKFSYFLHYDGLRPECEYFGMYPCHPHYEPQSRTRDESAIIYSYVPNFQQYRKN